MLKIADTYKLIARLTAEYGAENEPLIFAAFVEQAKKLSRTEKNPFFACSTYLEIYNHQKRKEINKKKQAHKRLTKDDIPFVTQLFTPHNIVSYIVHNAIGRLCDIDKEDLAFYDIFSKVPPNSNLKPLEDLRIIDLAVGTGNILYIVIELLQNQYKKLGQSAETIAQNISRNIVGIDIDARLTAICRQNLSDFAGAPINIYTLVPPSVAVFNVLAALELHKLIAALQNIYERGSLSIFDATECAILKANINNYTETAELHNELLNVVGIIDVLTQKYDAILINPPYLASSDYSPELDNFISENYKDYRSDLFSAFVYRGLTILKQNGYLGVVCPYNWMFIKHFFKLRELIIKKHTIANLAKFSVSGYKSAVVYLSAFIVAANRTDNEGSYIDLSRINAEELLQSCCKTRSALTYVKNQKDFLLSPTLAIIFWTSRQFLLNFALPPLSSVMDIRQGMATGNNTKYLKKICDVSPNEIAHTATSLDDFCACGKPYALYSKGGRYRKWYGNIDYVIKFDSLSREELSNSGNRLPSKQFYFRSAITWTLVSSKGAFGARIINNSVFDVGGSCGFPKDSNNIYVILAYLCSSVASAYLNALNPTINCQVGDIKKLPYIEPSAEDRLVIESLVQQNIAIAKDDWVSYAINNAPFSQKKRRNYYNKLKENEEKLNAIFINLYNLQQDISPEVKDKFITLLCK